MSSAVTPNKLMVVIGQLERGGAELHLLQLLSLLDPEAFEVVVVPLRPGGSLHLAFQDSGARVRDLPHYSRGLVGGLGAIRRLSKVVDDERPDIVHFFLPEAYLLGALSMLRYHPKGKIMSRRSLNLYQRNYPGAATLERLLHRSMDVCLGNSAAVAAELANEGISPDKIGVIYNGVDMQAAPNDAQRLALRSKLGLSADSLVIVTVANLIAYKGHSDVLEALGRITDALPMPWVWCSLGRDDGIGDALRAQAARLGVADNVRWMGEVDNVTEFLAVADLTVQASHQEGFSNAILESMAAGVAVIATEVGGNNEAVAHKVNGLLVPPAKPNELGQAILDLAGDREGRARMGLAGRERVAQAYSVDRCVQSYTKLYQNIINELPQPIPIEVLLEPAHD